MGRLKRMLKGDVCVVGGLATYQLSVVGTERVEERRDGVEMENEVDPKRRPDQHQQPRQRSSRADNTQQYAQGTALHLIAAQFNICFSFAELI